MNHVEEAHGEGHGHHPEHQMRIIVNGREKEVTGKKAYFEEIVRLSGLPGGQDITFTVTYKHGPEANRHGSLLDGESVEIKHDMIFNVTRTYKS